MSLLQIRESISEKPKRKAVGIDLGTTHSIVALSDDGGVHFFKKNEEVLIPSIVHYTENHEVLVGSDALAYIERDPLHTFYSIKRLMGRTVDELKTHNIHFPYAVVDKQTDTVVFEVYDKALTAIDISADILKSLMHVVQISEPIEQAVITVPAYFDETQRQATARAAQLAGIEVLRLLNEPTAAAIAYGLETKSEGFCLVYDLGGGTFDVSLLKIEKGVFEVLSMGGISHLGGDDFDQILVDKLAQRLAKPVNESALRMHAKKIKEKLSIDETVTVNIHEQVVTITREELQTWIMPLLSQTMDVVQDVLNNAQLSENVIDEVLLVGGSTRIPLIYTLLSEKFSGKILNHLDPDKVVAMGAAIQAGVLSGAHQGAHVLLDVVPLSLGLETMGGIVEKILLRNTKIPCKQKETFTTYQDNQTALSLHVLQGERELVQDCRSLARFDLTGIPPMHAGAARIEVTFQMDADGLLSVMAEELETKVKAQITVKPTFDLSSEAIGDLLNDSIQNASADIQNRKISQKCTDATQLKQVTEQALVEAKHLLTLDEITQIVENMRFLDEAVIKKESVAKLKEAINALESAVEPLMGKRLQWILNKSLAGKTLDEVTEKYDAN